MKPYSTPTRRHLRLATLIAAVLLLFPGIVAAVTALPTAEAKDANWLLVDTTSRTIAVFSGDRQIKQFNNIAIGRGGASMQRSRGDNTTPLGDFRIGWINTNSQFHIFLGFDFPTYNDASRAFAAGRLPLDDLLSVAHAARNRSLPPQTTPLGGHLGIHGLGAADEELHYASDWTRGCVAVTNAEIEKLLELVSIGTRVVVR